MFKTELWRPSSWLEDDIGESLSLFSETVLIAHLGWVEGATQVA